MLESVESCEGKEKIESNRMKVGLCGLGGLGGFYRGGEVCIGIEEWRIGDIFVEFWRKNVLEL